MTNEQFTEILIALELDITNKFLLRHGKQQNPNLPPGSPLIPTMTFYNENNGMALGTVSGTGAYIGTDPQNTLRRIFDTHAHAVAYVKAYLTGIAKAHHRDPIFTEHADSTEILLATSIPGQRH